MSMSDCKLTHTRLTDLLHYCPITGVFTMLTSRGGVRAGRVAGTPDINNYTQIRIDGKFYKAHRLAWFYTHGSMPLSDIDHINQDPSDNRIGNLREVEHVINRRNSRAYRSNTSGVTGVIYRECRPNRPFRACVKVDGVYRYKSFKHLENAIIWRELRLKEIDGYSDLHGLTDGEYGQMVLRIRNEVKADPEMMREKMIASEQQ